MLTPLERYALATDELSLSEKVRLLRAARHLVGSNPEDRKQIRGPFKKWGPGLRRWVMMKMIITNPRIVLIGIPVAMFSWVVLFANVFFRFNQS
jgi:hypothetical protein